MTAKVRVRQIEQVKAARDFHPTDSNKVDGEQRRGEPEDERADEAVFQRRLVLLLRQPEHHHRDDERVIGAEKPLEGNK